MDAVRSHAVARTSALAMAVIAIGLTGCAQSPIATPQGGTCDPARIEALATDLDVADAEAKLLDPVRDELYASSILCEGDQGPAEVEVDEIVDGLYQPDSGFTWDADSGELATSGFAVSPFPERSVTIASITTLSDAAIEEAIRSFASANADALAADNTYVGGWHDPDTGTVWLDIAVVTDSAEKARTIASEHDQLAFFDFQMQASVDVEIDSSH